jgi:hypothetical protein
VAGNLITQSNGTFHVYSHGAVIVNTIAVSSGFQWLGSLPNGDTVYNCHSQVIGIQGAQVTISRRPHMRDSMWGGAGMTGLGIAHGRILLGYGDGYTQAVDPVTRQQDRSMCLAGLADNEPVQAFAELPNGMIAVTGKCRAVVNYDSSYAYLSNARAILSCSDNHVAAAVNGVVKVWDFATTSLVSTLPCRPCTAYMPRMCPMTQLPDGRLAVIWDQAITL